MKSHSQLVRWPIIILGLTIGVCAQAQTFFVGPTAWYLVSTGMPEGTNAQSQPTRYVVGVASDWLIGKKAELRSTLGYRSETGSFETPQSRAPQAMDGRYGSGSTVQVVDNPSAEPNLLSTISASSLEFTTSLCFPILPLDSSGAAIGIALGAMADVVLDAYQDDDYSAILDHQGPTIVHATYNQQVGFGALLGTYLMLPLGSSRMSFDLQYVFRAPTTLTTNTTPPIDQQTSWLIGQGLRVGLCFYFGV